MVVPKWSEQDTVRRREPILQLLHRGGNALLGLEIAVIQRDLANRRNLDC